MDSDSEVHVEEHSGQSSDDILHCWKDIATYLQRDVRTVTRWEHSRGMPVHRLPGGPKAAVYALKSELDAWRAAGSSGAVSDTSNTTEDEPPVHKDDKRTFRPLTIGIVAVACLALVALAIVAIAKRKTAEGSAPIRSLAVLPFENLNRDSSEDYLAGGIHDALITDLASTAGVRVISRASVMRYRGAHIPATQIAKELNVDAFVEGSVLRVDNKVRITAQLVRANDEHLWARSYDRELQDVLNVMAEISDSIAGEVQRVVALDGAKPPVRRPHRTVPAEAVDVYLRAQHEFQTVTPNGLESALKLYQKTIELDPQFALGWNGIASALMLQAFFGYRVPSEVLPEARNAAVRALAADDSLGEAYGTLGYIALYWDWDFEGAGKTLVRAIELSPNNTMVRHEYADYLLVARNPEESLRQVTLGELYNPQSPQIKGVWLYHALMARHYDEVITEGQKMVRSTPVSLAFHEWYGRAFWLKGREAEALSEWRLALGADSQEFAKIEAIHKTSGGSAALAALGQQFAYVAEKRQTAAISVAGWFAAAGDADEAMRWLERSYAKKEPLLLHVVADPFFDPIRSDPRFESLLRRIGITPQGQANGRMGQKQTTGLRPVLPIS